MGTSHGQAITFNESDARAIGRVATGVRGIKLADKDTVVGMDIAEDGKHILTVTENGYGKLTKVSLYPQQNRAGKGVQNYKLTAKTGLVTGLMCIDKELNDIMMISDDGVVIRMESAGISTMGRSTSGVKVMRLEDEIRVATIAKVNKIEDDENDDQLGMDENVLGGEEDGGDTQE